MGGSVTSGTPGLAARLAPQGGPGSGSGQGRRRGPGNVPEARPAGQTQPRGCWGDPGQRVRGEAGAAGAPPTHASHGPAPSRRSSPGFWPRRNCRAGQAPPASWKWCQLCPQGWEVPRRACVPKSRALMVTEGEWTAPHLALPGAPAPAQTSAPSGGSSAGTKTAPAWNLGPGEAAWVQGGPWRRSSLVGPVSFWPRFLWSSWPRTQGSGAPPGTVSGPGETGGHEPGHTHPPATNAGNRRAVPWGLWLELRTVRAEPELRSRRTVNRLSHRGARDVHVLTNPTPPPLFLSLTSRGPHLGRPW